jgi:hypothetical protein
LSQTALRPGVDALPPDLESLAQLRPRNMQSALLASVEDEPASDLHASVSGLTKTHQRPESVM